LFIGHVKLDFIIPVFESRHSCETLKEKMIWFSGASDLVIGIGCRYWGTGTVMRRGVSFLDRCSRGLKDYAVREWVNSGKDQVTVFSLKGMIGRRRAVTVVNLLTLGTELANELHTGPLEIVEKRSIFVCICRI
jgi:hypothetical protein